MVACFIFTSVYVTSYFPHDLLLPDLDIYFIVLLKLGTHKI